MATASEWTQRIIQQKKANIGRNIDCMVLSSAYAGNLWNLNGVPFEQDRTGKVILRNRNMDGGNRNKPLVVNYLKGIVDDYVALLGSLPDVKVPPPGASPEEQVFADRVERYHYGIWHASDLGMQMKAVAWWNSVMGSSVGIVWPDFKRKHPVFRFVAPYMAYLTADLGSMNGVAEAIIVERFPTASVKAAYPRAAFNNPLAFMVTNESGNAQNFMGGYGAGNNPTDGSTEVAKCFDKQEVVTIINGIEVARARHEMDFCPVVVFPNIYVPGMLNRNHSDIEQVVGLAQHASFLAQSTQEYILQEIYAPLVVEGLSENKVPEDINPLDPLTVIPVNIGGKVYRLMGGHGSQVALEQMNAVQGMIEYNTGVPQVRMEGNMKSSITTGRGIDRAQGPYFSRTLYKTDMLSMGLEKMNAMAVNMQTALWPHEDFQLFGMRGRSKSLYATKMNTDELDNYDFNKVLYSMAMGMDPMQRMVFAQQGLNEKSQLFDRRWAIEFLGITDHPEEMIERIDAEQERNLQRDMRLQQGAQAPVEAAPVPGGPAPLTANGAPPNPATPAPPGGAPVPSAQPMSPATKTGEGGPAPTFPLDRNAPPAPDIGDVSSGLDGSLKDQVSRIVRGLNLSGPVYALEQGDRLRLVVTKPRDAKKLHNALDDLYAKRIVIRTSTNVPQGAEDIAAKEAVPA